MVFLFLIIKNKTSYNIIIICKCVSFLLISVYFSLSCILDSSNDTSQTILAIALNPPPPQPGTNKLLEKII